MTHNYKYEGLSEEDRNALIPAIKHKKNKDKTKDLVVDQSEAPQAVSGEREDEIPF